METNESYSVRMAPDDPLYSIPDNQNSQPFQIPSTFQVPYFQEIESDGVKAAAADYEEPVPQSRTKQCNGTCTTSTIYHTHCTVCMH